MADAPGPPKGLRTAGQALWASVLAEYELEQHEVVTLTAMCRVADVLDELAQIVRAEGVVDQHGRAHPAAIESRQQAITYARLSAALRLPSGDENDHQQGARRPQRRAGARGVYGIRGAVS